MNREESSAFHRRHPVRCQQLFSGEGVSAFRFQSSKQPSNIETKARYPAGHDDHKENVPSSNATGAGTDANASLATRAKKLRRKTLGVQRFGDWFQGDIDVSGGVDFSGDCCSPGRLCILRAGLPLAPVFLARE